MSDGDAHVLREWMDRELLSEREIHMPEELKGLRFRGFLLSEDRRACITLDPGPLGEPLRIKGDNDDE